MSSSADELARLRETASKALLVVLWLYVLVAAAIGLIRDMAWPMPTSVMLS
ncbi:hypothetical protein [Bradyrhizobium sp. ORS 111]|uniref:hypothetical protein n=1 Tax=Bradyrhizobium sp. ORS 111 TaxID=1685958 RepID=UPI00389089BE